MTSRSLFFNLMKEDAKRRLWTIAFAFLTFFFSFPVWTALRFSGYNMKEQSDYVYMVSELNSLFGFDNGWIAVLFMMLSLIMGVTSFSYLHSRQKVDFYHGIPVNRTKLFWANYANGILIPVVLYGVNLLAAMIVAMVHGIMPGVFAVTAGKAFLFFLIHYSMIYSVTVMSMILTGNIIIGILGTGILHFFFPTVLMVLELCYQFFFRTSYRGGSPFFELLMDKCSAFTLFISNIALAGGRDFVSQGVRLAAAAAVTAVLAFLSLLLYKKRGSEAAGKAMAFKISKPIIRIPIVVLSALCGSLLFYGVRQSMGWTLFGLVCGMLLSHCVIEIIYHFDFRKLFADRIQMVLCALAALLIFCGFRYDWFGYDSYIPSANQLESVAVSDDLNNWISYGTVVKTSNGDYEWDYQSDDDYIFSHMELTNTEPVLSLVKEAVKRNKELYHSGQRTEDWDYDMQYYRFSVKYNLKNGKSVYRTYTISSKEAERRPEVIELYRDQNFLQGVYPVLTQTPEDTARVRVSVGEQTVTASSDKNGMDKAMTEELLTVYQEEFKSLTPEVMEKENPMATIQFMTKDQADAEEKRKELQSSWKYGDVIDRGYYPVYPSFEKTIALLKECQVDIESWNKVDSEIEKIYINLANTRDSDVPDLLIEDPEQIRQIMKEAMIVDYANMNPLNIEMQVSFTAVEKAYSSAQTGSGSAENKKGGASIECSIPMSKLPGEMIEEITRLQEE